MNIQHRPMLWAPRPDTSPRRSRWAFKATLGQTMTLLRREVAQLDGDNVLIGGEWRESQLRMDGGFRGGSPVVPAHPGIEVSFDSRVGRVVLATDVCVDWQHNLRSIALGLEALRAVDRYGCSSRGQQYAGFRALPSGTGGAGAPDTMEAAKHVLVEIVGGDIRAIAGMRSDAWQRVVREALRKTHPDTGGNATVFGHVQAAARILRSAGVIT